MVSTPLPCDNGNPELSRCYENLEHREHWFHLNQPGNIQVMSRHHLECARVFQRAPVCSMMIFKNYENSYVFMRINVHTHHREYSEKIWRRVLRTPPLLLWRGAPSLREAEARGSSSSETGFSEIMNSCLEIMSPDTKWSFLKPKSRADAQWSALSFGFVHVWK